MKGILEAWGSVPSRVGWFGGGGLSAMGSAPLSPVRCGVMSGGF